MKPSLKQANSVESELRGLAERRGLLINIAWVTRVEGIFCIYLTSGLQHSRVLVSDEELNQCDSDQEVEQRISGELESAIAGFVVCHAPSSKHPHSALCGKKMKQLSVGERIIQKVQRYTDEITCAACRERQKSDARSFLGLA